jgi:hypothetical protein
VPILGFTSPMIKKERPSNKKINFMVDLKLDLEGVNLFNRSGSANFRWVLFFQRWITAKRSIITGMMNSK